MRNETMESPNIVIVAGPNGAGKSTAAPSLLRDFLGITEFVNADVFAQGLSAFNPAGAAVQAGRIMLSRMRELADDRKSFAYETTLAARSHANWMQELREAGYQIHLVYLWIRSPDTAVERVAERVRQGGHNIPEDVIRRRYERGLRNLFNIYIPIVDSWVLLDNSDSIGYVTIATQMPGTPIHVSNERLWIRIKEKFLETLL
jgi:predicted ABC-type ATPase